MDNLSDNTDLSRLLPLIIDIAKGAGDVIMDVYGRTSFEVIDKEDDSPVTEADIRAHNLIHERLSELAVHFPVLSEESLKVSPAERRSWQTYWLVDPLDGTREFVKRSDEFSVNIALIHAGEAVLGVIYAPVSKITHYAARGFGAYKDNVGDIQAIKTRDMPANPVIFGSRSHQSKRFHEYLKNVPVYQLKPMGSSLKSCMIAEGRADLYIRFGPTCEWDTAAAQCILEEAGACIVAFSLKRLAYNQKDSLLNPEFIVCKQTALDTWASYLQDRQK